METLEQLAEAIDFNAQLVSDDFIKKYDHGSRVDLQGQSHWVVTIIHNGQSFSTDYHQGAAYREHRSPTGRKGSKVKFKYARGGGITLHEEERLLRSVPTVPTVTDVMYCLVSDAQCAEYGDFDDFCDNLGYDNDSREAERIYNACRDTFFKLRSMFNLEQLSELFQDY